jgi:ABC-2 type transport system permease protein
VIAGQQELAASVPAPSQGGLRGLLSDTWLLISLRWHLTWNGFRKRSMAARVLSVLGMVLFGLFISAGAAGMGIALGAVLRRSPDPSIAILLVAAVLAVVSVLLLLTSFGVALGSLFLASDMEMLMSAPVDRRAVFISKLLDGMVPSYSILLVSALPALLAFGIGLGYSAAYYFMVALVVLFLPLLPMGLGAMLVLVVARVAPARRVREVLGLVGTLFGVSCGILGQTSRQWTSMFTPGREEAEQFVEWLRGLANWPLPFVLAARSTVDAGRGDFAGALPVFGGFVLMTAGLFAVSVWLAEALYASGWVRMQSSGSAKKSMARSARAASRSGWLGRAPAWFAIVLKDWRVLPRDLRNFAQMLAPLALVPFILWNLLSVGGRRNPYIETFGAAGGSSILIAGGVLMTVMFVVGRVAETSISMESKSWWLIKAAPVSPGEVLFGKFMTAAIPYVALGTIFMAALTYWRGFDLVWAVYGWMAVLVLGLGMVAAAVGLSVPWAKLDWDDPRRMLTWQTSVITMLAWVGIGLAGGVLFCLPYFGELLGMKAVGPLMVVGLVLGSAVAAGSGYALLHMGVARLGVVGEE